MEVGHSAEGSRGRDVGRQPRRLPAGEGAARRTSGRRKWGRAGGAAGGGGRAVRAGRSQSGEVEVGMEKWDRRGKSGSGDRGGDRWEEVGRRKPGWGGKLPDRGRGREVLGGSQDQGREVGIGAGKPGSRKRWGLMEESRDWGQRWISMEEVGGGMLGCGRKSTKGTRGREVDGGGLE
ncbi:hypothetical protein CBR_g39144 [Chara braunii]|uniref:Uncharacterized protein n=1 Tax=Chara braunii TaxID=69332 RepID=A0A388LR22_CHABU|nr:hypothetical protein CBR_g39144 [Chara braunii]|eukprot:GBG84767.1 hypothetical protein CBR_g39144 [Chara braunii]